MKTDDHSLAAIAKNEGTHETNVEKNSGTNETVRPGGHKIRQRTIEGQPASNVGDKTTSKDIVQRGRETHSGLF